MNPGREAVDRNQLFSVWLVVTGTFSERNDYKRDPKHGRGRPLFVPENIRVMVTVTRGMVSPDFLKEVWENRVGNDCRIGIS